jgi:hypothetical protein
VPPAGVRAADDGHVRWTSSECPQQPPVTLGVHHDRCENEEDVRVTFSVDNAQTAARAVLARVQAV